MSGELQIGVILLVMFGVEAEVQRGCCTMQLRGGRGHAKAIWRAAGEDALESKLVIPTRSAEDAASRLLRVMIEC
jgi:hypothetical protein